MKTYYAIAELYSSVTKGQPVISESFSVHGAPPNAAARVDSYRRPVDPRLNRAAPGDAVAAGGRGKKRDRRFGAYNGGGGAAPGYADYSEDAVGDYVQAAAAAGYSQYGGAAQAQAQHWSGYASYYNAGGPWQAATAAREPEEAAYAASSASEQHSDRERIVEFSQSTPAHSGYGQYYGDGAWAGGYNGGTGAPQYMPPPMVQGYPDYGPAGQYGPQHSDSNGNSRYGHRPLAPGDRTAVYGRLKVRS